MRAVERGQRIGLIVAALAVAALAFVLLSPSDSDDDDTTPTQAEQTRQPGNGQGEPTATVRAPKPKPSFSTITIADGKVRGGEARINVKKGDTARIAVRSDKADEIHLHGYDVYKDVTPRKPARFQVKADIEGVFEIEAHDLGHVIIGTLVVEP
jgi:hypothetical protein